MLIKQDEKVRYLNLILNKEELDRHFATMIKMINKGYYCQNNGGTPVGGGDFRVTCMIDERVADEFLKTIKG